MLLVTAHSRRLRLWEIVLLSLVIQWGMLPLLAQDFHRVSLAGSDQQYSRGASDRHDRAAWIFWLSPRLSFGCGWRCCSHRHSDASLELLLATVEWFSRMAARFLSAFRDRRCGW